MLGRAHWAAATAASPQNRRRGGLREKAEPTPAATPQQATTPLPLTNIHPTQIRTHPVKPKLNYAISSAVRAAGAGATAAQTAETQRIAEVRPAVTKRGVAQGLVI